MDQLGTKYRWMGRGAIALALVMSAAGIVLVSDPRLGQHVGVSAGSLVGSESEAPEISAEDGLAGDQNSDALLTEVSESSPIQAGAMTIDLKGSSGVLREEEPELPEEDVVPEFDREGILDDAEDRVSDKFDIPANLRPRVAFWFDIYAKYDSNKRVIHHVRFPWIVYKVVDVSDIINSDTPKWRWMRNQHADKKVASEMREVREALKFLAGKRRAGELSPETVEAVREALAQLPGKEKAKAQRAIGEVRVQTGQRDFFANGIAVSPRYLGTMEKIFQRHGLPTELTRLPFVESSFNGHATSKVGASGIWQFMGNTGRKFMTVNDIIDERRSPFKSTEGAARLLKENHLILYRSWGLALTAWNHGPGGIKKASKIAGSRDLGTIISRYQSRTFDFASSNFYAEFLAALHTEKYSDRIFPAVVKVAPVDLQVVRLVRKLRAGDLMRKSGLSNEDFLLYNPELALAVKRNLPLPAGFKVHLPNDPQEELEALVRNETPVDPS